MQKFLEKRERMSIHFPMVTSLTSIPANSLSHAVEGNKDRTSQGKVIHEDLQASIEAFNKVSKRALTFNIHKELDRVYVQVIDQETDEIVREVPPEKILDLIASMMKSAGLIVDRQI